MSRHYWALAVICLLFSVPARAGTVEGEAFYRERIALPPQAVFEAELLIETDTQPVHVVGRATHAPAGLPPFHFTINYVDNPSLDNATLLVRATVMVGGVLWFKSDRKNSAVDGGKLKILMVSARGSAPVGVSPLRNTYWRLTEIDGAPVQRAERQREPHMILAADRMHVAGNGGCNRFTGNFTLNGQSIRFGHHMAATMMACADGMEQERLYLKALGNVASYRIEADRLVLLDGSGKILLQFSAVALR